MSQEYSDYTKEYINSIRKKGFKKTGNTLVRNRGKNGVEIIDMDALTWYMPKTAQNSEQYWQYNGDLNDMLWSIVKEFSGWLISARHNRSSILLK